MADNYQIIDSYRTVQVLSQQVVQDVQYITGQTSPTGITFGYPMYIAVWQDGPPYQILGIIATELENLATYEHVVGGQAVQDINESGLLTDYIALTVEYDQTAAGLPPLQGTVNLPLNLIILTEAEEGLPIPAGTQTPAQVVGAEYDRLEALATG